MHLGYKDKSNFRLIIGLYYFSDSFLCSRFVRIDIQTNRKRFLSLFTVGQTLLSLSNYKSFFKIKIQQYAMLFSFQYLLEEVALVPERSLKISIQVLLSTMSLDPEVSKFLDLMSDIYLEFIYLFRPVEISTFSSPGSYSSTMLVRFCSKFDTTVPAIQSPI